MSCLPRGAGGSSPKRALRLESDEVLIESCLSGNDAAWEEMLRRFGRLVYSVPYRYSLDAAACDDVLQEVFCILVRQLPHLRNRAAIKGWLVTTAHRVSRRHKSKTITPLDVTAEDDAEDAPPAEQVVRWERQVLVRDALERLGGRCEALLTALYLEPGRMSYEVLSRQLRIPLGSIGPTRTRCLMKLTKLVESVGLGRAVFGGVEDD